jgi:hypothetical protein
MGDYATNNKGQEFKIGTCGQGYYTTFKMLEDLEDKNSDVLYYLKGDKVSAVFPFPEHDNKQPGEISQFHEDKKIFFNINIPASVIIYHDRITHHIQPRGGANGGVNMFMDCPYENDNISKNFDKSRVSMLLDYEYRKEGKGYIQCSCPYCGEKNWFDEKEIKEILEFNLPGLYSELEKTQTNFIYNSDRYDEYQLKDLERYIEGLKYKIEVFNRIIKIYQIV